MIAKKCDLQILKNHLHPVMPMLLLLDKKLLINYDCRMYIECDKVMDSTCFMFYDAK